MNDIIDMALNAPGCERLKEWVAVGPVQRAAFEEAAELIAAAEREKLKWNSIHSCHADCQNLACVIVREAVAAEREACAKVCENADRYRGDYFAALIRARGQA